MAHFPGQTSDVYFGDPEKPLPDWRTQPASDDEDAPDDVPSPGVIAILGFDPREVGG